MSPPNPIPPALPPGATAAPAPGKKALNGCLIAALIGVVLLIGIFVIAIVAAVALPVLTSAKQRGKSAEARILATTILTSCRGYFAEYRRYPVPENHSGGGPSPLRTDQGLTGTLLGTSVDQNPKKVVFLPELNPVENGRGPGLLVRGDTAIIVDPWGEAYYVLFDTDNDGTIPNPDSRPGALPVLQQGVLVYSAGPDKDPNTWEDNPTSWDSGNRFFSPRPTPPPTPIPPSATPPPSPVPPR